MATKKPKKRWLTFRFELGLGGMFGLGLVCFCIFLWMFLLGVWSGQTVLLPSAPGKGPETLNRLAAKLWRHGGEELTGGPAPQAQGPVEETASSGGDQPPVENTISGDKQAERAFFTLQVGSFREQKKAEREALGWKAKGQDAFYVPPADGGDTYRVFIGRFEKLAEANSVAAGLEKEEEVRAYVTLLPAAKLAAAGQEKLDKAP